MSPLLRKVLILAFLTIPGFVFSQIEFSLKLNYDSTKWGVFARPDATITPSTNTLTGAGQVTLVASNGFTVSGLKNISGTWVQNARSNNPVENPDVDYISFGLTFDTPKILYQAGFETLLFSIDRIGDCPDTLYLINDNDPFSAPNSQSSNPNNDLFVLDTSDGSEYYFSKNYDLCAWSCSPCTDGTQVSGVGEFSNLGIELYPNPVAGSLNIRSTDFRVEAIQLFDLFGNLRLNESVTGNSVDVSELPAGIYVAVLKNKGTELLRKKIQIVE